MLGPVAHFSRTFIWVVLLSGIGVLVLSGTQIRRSLVPLVELREGTSRIAQRDFGSRVRVTSRDEFEELANAFNGMAVQLGASSRRCRPPRSWTGPCSRPPTSPRSWTRCSRGRGTSFPAIWWASRWWPPTAANR